MTLAHRRRWNVRIAVAAALAITVLGISWLARPPVLDTVAASLSSAITRIEPVLIGEHFLLQAVTCQERLGFRCARVSLPEDRGFVSRRPSINPGNAVSRREARREISEGLGSASAWGRALAAAPGAAVFTARYITSFGWAAWVAVALSLFTAMTLLFRFVDSVAACLVFTPVAAIGVSWALATALTSLARFGPASQFAFLVAVIVLVLGLAQDALEASATAERVRRWRQRRQMARADLRY